MRTNYPEIRVKLDLGAAMNRCVERNLDRGRYPLSD